MEDTAFYRYSRLTSLNEVGGHPQHFGVSVAAFHQQNQDRAEHWPHAMLASSTHEMWMLPLWKTSCNKVDPTCSAVWNGTVGKARGYTIE